MKTILVDAGGTFVRDGKIYQPLYELLEQYPNNKIVLSNADDKQIVDVGLVNLPYPLFTLKHNPDKADPIYFKTLLEQYNLKPSDVICFDHIPEAVTSAESIGIASYYYNIEERDLDKLKKFIDKNI